MRSHLNVHLSVLALACVVFPAVVSAAPSFQVVPRGDDTFPVAVKQVSGKVNKLEAVMGTLILHTSEAGKGVVKEFSLAGKNIPVTTEVGEKLKLTDIPVGAQVSIGLAVTEDVVKIVAKSPRQEGTLKAIGDDGQTLKLYISSKVPDETLRLAVSPLILLGDQKLTPADLFPGLAVGALLSFDRSTAHQLTVSLQRGAKDPRGVLVHVDPVKHTVQLFSGRAYKLDVATYPVARDFRFFFNNRLHKVQLKDLPAVKTVSELPKALPVWAQLDAELKTVVALVATSPTLPGVVQKVQADSGVLHVKTSLGVENFTILKNAKIIIRGKSTKLGDIPPGLGVDLHLALNPSEVVAVRSSKKQTKQEDTD